MAPCASASSVGAPPAAGTDHSREGEAEYVMNTTRAPSGDQAGVACPPTGWLEEVRRRRLRPSASTVQIVEGMLAPNDMGVMSARGSDWKARRRPSGDQAGSEPNSLRRRGTPPRAGRTQIPPSRIE